MRKTNIFTLCAWFGLTSSSVVLAFVSPRLKYTRAVCEHASSESGSDGSDGLEKLARELQERAAALRSSIAKLEVK
jgi:hypothetical protein